MKNTIRTLVLILAISHYSFAQNSQSADTAFTIEQEKSIDSIVSELLNDKELYKPYEVTANHMSYSTKMLEMVKNDQDSVLIRISQTPRFSGVLSIDQEGRMTEVKSLDGLADLIKKLRVEIKELSSLAPTNIETKFFLGDNTRFEDWEFKNTNGGISKFTVTFTNGQITVFLFKI